MRHPDFMAPGPLDDGFAFVLLGALLASLFAVWGFYG